jgi:hypothetical protein
MQQDEAFDLLKMGKIFFLLVQLAPVKLIC